jgi:glycosyltransferase involved in cell wall biosynthesis
LSDAGEKIRVLQIVTTTIGGAGEHLLLLSKGLDRNRFEVTVAFSPGMPLDPEFEKAGLRVVHLPMDRSASILTNLKGFFQLLALMRRERFDIVQTHTSVAGLLGRVTAKMTRVPIVIHMLHAYSFHDYVPAARRWLFLRIERALDLITDHYIAGSDAIRNKGISSRVMAPERVRRIYYALDPQHLDSQESVDPEALRREVGAGAGEDVVGLIGRLELQKGVTYFLEAAVEISRARPGTRFVVVGDGPLRTSLEEEARRLGLAERVYFLGWRVDMMEVLRGIDVLVLSSLWEAFGIVNLEAMAWSKPVVATAVEGIPEVVEDGVTGLLVPPCDPHALARATLEILGDEELRARMGAAGRRRVEAVFGAGQMIEEHERLYLQLLDEKSGRRR